jgi:hypothetical protein
VPPHVPGEPERRPPQVHREPPLGAPLRRAVTVPGGPVRHLRPAVLPREREVVTCQTHITSNPLDFFNYSHILNTNDGLRTHDAERRDVQADLPEGGVARTVRADGKTVAAVEAAPLVRTGVWICQPEKTH